VIVQDLKSRDAESDLLLAFFHLDPSTSVGACNLFIAVSATRYPTIPIVADTTPIPAVDPSPAKQDPIEELDHFNFVFVLNVAKY
jgi:hypothetical protein